MDLVSWLPSLLLFFVFCVTGGIAVYFTIRNTKRWEKRLEDKEAQIQKAEDTFKLLMEVSRQQMLDLDERCENRGYTTLAERTFFETLYDLYDKLGGNNIIVNERKNFLALPTVGTVRRINPSLFRNAEILNGTWLNDAYIGEWEKENHVINKEMADMKARQAIELMKGDDAK